MAAFASLLILGGARSGKSAYALERARALGGRTAFVATAEPLDPEMAARIARHRRGRPPDWATVEAPLDLASALETLDGKADTVVVDCLTLWVSNRLLRDPALLEERLLAEAGRLAARVTRPPYALIVVSNEVGSGVHPETALGRRFRDCLGLVNQTLARAAHEVVLLVAGCPTWLKRP